MSTCVGAELDTVSHERLSVSQVHLLGSQLVTGDVDQRQLATDALCQYINEHITSQQAMPCTPSPSIDTSLSRRSQHGTIPQWNTRQAQHEHCSLMATFHYAIQVADMVCDLVVDLLARTSSVLATT